jgi:polyhydroxyalkanoate synthase
MIPSPRSLRAAVSNVASKLLYGHVADLRPMPVETVGDGPMRSVFRYRPPDGVVPAGPPVLFVSPLAAPTRCYDLRRGCSVAEHVIAAGRLSYLLDYGPIGHSGRDLAFEEWIREVLPAAIRAVSADASGQPVQLVGWCLGGIFSLLTAADDPGLPIASITVIGAPVDNAAASAAGPLRRLGEIARRPETGMTDISFGGTLQPLVKQSARLVGFDKYLTRPYRILTNLDDTEFLAQAEAVEHFTNSLTAYPGRTFKQLYQALFHRNDLAGGGIDVGARRIDLDKVRVPVLVIAGQADGVAPVQAVRPLTRLLSGSPEVRFEVVPGGHLDALTGSSARTTTWAHLDRWLDEGIVRHGIRPARRTAAKTS